MATITLPGTSLTDAADYPAFRVWDFSTVEGGGFAVLRAAWCPTTVRSSADQEASRLGAGWCGTSTTVRCHSVSYAETLYRTRAHAPATDVRRCTCGCLSRHGG